MTHLFCFGLGYSAAYLADDLIARGWHVAGTSTRAIGSARLQARGFDGLVFDGRTHTPEVAEALQSATHILLSIPPDAGGDPALRVFGEDIASAPNIGWIGYLSTVGVYGDANGGWVDEDTPAQPLSDRGQRRLAAETAWRAFGKRTGKAVMVFRLPGIYGPGRSTLDDLRGGEARRIIKPEQVFNRIHVADIAASIAAGIAAPRADRVYNVTDDEPGPPQDVVAFGAELLGMPVPPGLDFATTELTPMARSFYSESKRVSNARLHQELGVKLKYPTYREGLRGIYDAGG
ncbi:MAG: SDR family oxidoreductase [Hyphomicrobium sp.]|nr:SDR family oxidoreductase [Hyphomicrobium sp.]